MSFAPQTLLDLRDYLQAKTGLSDNELGIVGNEDHTYGYHLGEDRLPKDDYSARTKRDLAGLTDAASASDIGMFARLVEMTLWLVDEGRAGRAPDIREIIGPAYDGRAYRYDSLSGWNPQQRAQGDPHEWHTHVSWYRDSEFREKVSLFKRFFDAQGDDMFADDPDAQYEIWRVMSMAYLGDGQGGDKIPDGPEKGVVLPFVKAFKTLHADVAELKARPPVESAPVDPAALKAVILDPQVLAAIAKAVTDEIGS